MAAQLQLCLNIALLQQLSVHLTMHAARMIARSSSSLLANTTARRAVRYSRGISVVPRAFKEEKAGGEQQQERQEVARTGKQEEGLAAIPRASSDLLPFRCVAKGIWWA
jgi:hypothetical protein